MLERILFAPLPFLDDKASSFPIDLGHGFSLLKFTDPQWLVTERKKSLFLSATDIERLGKEEYWLTLTVEGEAAIGKAENEAEHKMKLFLFLATLFSPCYGMFIPSFLVEKSPSSPNGRVRQTIDLREGRTLALPEMFRHNALTLESLHWSSKWLDRCVAIHSSSALTFRIAGTLWRVGFKQNIHELQLLLWTMGIESVLGSATKREFTERLRILIDGSVPLYQEGTHNRLNVRRDSDYSFGHLWEALYDARGQVAHGQAFSPTFLDKVQNQLAEIKPPKTIGDDKVPLGDILVETSCLTLQKLLLMILQDPHYAFLVEDVTRREQKLRAFAANKKCAWVSQQT